MERQINIYEFVMERLSEKQIPQKRIAAESGVPFSTVCKIAQGAVREPSVHSIQKLYDYFTGGTATANPENTSFLSSDREAA